MSNKNLHQKLQGIQSSLKAPKGQTNKFGGYKYRSCEDILTALKPLLAEWECSLVIHDEIVEVGGRVYVKATCELLDSNDSNAVVSSTGFAREAEVKKGMDDAQITGSASSYARKYALNGLFCIDDNKDADSTNNHGKGKPAATTKPASKPKADKAKFEEVLSYVQSNPKFLQGALDKFAWTTAQRKALTEAAA